MDLQQVPSLQNVHEVQEVQWVQGGQTCHLYQGNQQIQQGPTTMQNLKIRFSTYIKLI